jgi:hypothetical protein
MAKVHATRKESLIKIKENGAFAKPFTHYNIVGGKGKRAIAA